MSYLKRTSVRLCLLLLMTCEHYILQVQWESTVKAVWIVRLARRQYNSCSTVDGNDAKKLLFAVITPMWKSSGSKKSGPNYLAQKPGQMVWLRMTSIWKCLEKLIPYYHNEFAITATTVPMANKARTEYGNTCIFDCDDTNISHSHRTHYHTEVFLT